MKLNKKILFALAIAFTTYLGALTPSASAANSFFDDASIVTGGNLGNAAQLVSDTTPGWGGISFDSANNSLISSLTNLSSDYNVTNDDCFGGSPRFQIRVDADNNNLASAGDKSIFVYFGPHPNFTNCTPNTWLSTGNLTTTLETRWDTSQVGGTFYDTFLNASNLTSAFEIISITLVVDSGWGFGDSEQTILVDNIQINSNIEDFDLLPVAIISPLHNSIVTVSALDKVDWNDASDGNPLYEYQYEAYSDFGYSSLIYASDWLPNSEITTVGTPIGTYYLRVRVKDILGAISDWSNGSGDEHKITVIADPSVTPTPTPNPFAVPAQCDQNISYNLIKGTNSANTIYGTGGNDLIFGLSGSDRIDGKGGNDCIVAGNGSDSVDGGSGDDVILGGDNADSLKGGGENDKLYGEGGSDTMDGGSGNDTIDGGPGSDKAIGGSDTDTCTAETKKTCEV